MKVQNNKDDNSKVIVDLCSKADMMSGIQGVTEKIDTFDVLLSKNFSRSNKVVEDIGILSYELSTFKDAVIANVLMKLSSLESSSNEIVEQNEIIETKLEKRLSTIESEFSDLKDTVVDMRKDLADLALGIKTLVKDKSKVSAT